MFDAICVPVTQFQINSAINALINKQGREALVCRKPHIEVDIYEHETNDRYIGSSVRQYLIVRLLIDPINDKNKTVIYHEGKPDINYVSTIIEAEMLVERLLSFLNGFTTTPKPITSPLWEYPVFSRPAGLVDIINCSVVLLPFKDETACVISEATTLKEFHKTTTSTDQTLSADTLKAISQYGYIIVSRTNEKTGLEETGLVPITNLSMYSFDLLNGFRFFITHHKEYI